MLGSIPLDYIELVIDRVALMFGGHSDIGSGHLENGRRGLTIEWVERLAHALDCHPFELVFDGHYARSDHEETLLQVFRKLSLEQQVAVLNAAVMVLR